MQSVPDKPMTKTMSPIGLELLSSSHHATVTQDDPTMTRLTMPQQ